VTNRRDVIKGSLALAARSAVLPGVTATLASCGGGGGATLSPPSGLSYSSPVAGTVGTALATFSPTVTGTVSSYTVASALPAGLSLNGHHRDRHRHACTSKHHAHLLRYQTLRIARRWYLFWSTFLAAATIRDWQVGPSSRGCPS
jgi:hypothetical protein